MEGQIKAVESKIDDKKAKRKLLEAQLQYLNSQLGSNRN